MSRTWADCSRPPGWRRRWSRRASATSTTWTDHPLLDRDALINAVDFEATPSGSLRFSGQMIRSDISQSGMNLNPGSTDPQTDGRMHGYEAWLQADFNRSAPITHTLKALHIDDRFDLNDLGYMERNALEQLEWETNRRVAAVDGGRVNGEVQRLYAYYRENTAGERLQSRVQLSRDVQYVSSWRAYEEVRYITSGVDDLISRGNGPVQLDARVGAYFDVTSPRFGDWQFVLGGYSSSRASRTIPAGSSSSLPGIRPKSSRCALICCRKSRTTGCCGSTTISSGRIRLSAWISISASTGSLPRAMNCE